MLILCEFFLSEMPQFLHVVFDINLKTLSYNFLHSVWFALRFQEMLYAKKKKTVFLAASFGDLLLHKKQNIFFCHKKHHIKC